MKICPHDPQQPVLSKTSFPPSAQRVPEIPEMDSGSVTVKVTVPWQSALQSMEKVCICLPESAVTAAENEHPCDLSRLLRSSTPAFISSGSPQPDKKRSKIQTAHRFKEIPPIS